MLTPGAEAPARQIRPKSARGRDFFLGPVNITDRAKCSRFKVTNLISDRARWGLLRLAQGCLAALLLHRFMHCWLNPPPPPPALILSVF